MAKRSRGGLKIAFEQLERTEIVQHEGVLRLDLQGSANRLVGGRELAVRDEVPTQSQPRGIRQWVEFVAGAGPRRVPDAGSVGDPPPYRRQSRSVLMVPSRAP
jgi:hypothetical protein